MGIGTDHINTFMYCIHAGLTTSGRVLTLSEIIIFLPRLNEKEDLDILESQWDLPEHHSENENLGHEATI